MRWGLPAGAAQSEGAQSVDAAGDQLLRGSEGFRAYRYNDGDRRAPRVTKVGHGNCTIGYGHLVHLGPCHFDDHGTRIIDPPARPGNKPARAKGEAKQAYTKRLKQWHTAVKGYNAWLNADANEQRLLGDISQAEAEALYRGDVKRNAEDPITKRVKAPLTQRQFDGLAALLYNTGPGGLGCRGLLKALNARKWAIAGALMRHCLVRPKSLQGRRNRDADYFLGIVHHKAKKKVPKGEKKVPGQLTIDVDIEGCGAYNASGRTSTVSASPAGSFRRESTPANDHFIWTYEHAPASVTITANPGPGCGPPTWQYYANSLWAGGTCRDLQTPASTCTVQGPVPPDQKNSIGILAGFTGFGLA